MKSKNGVPLIGIKPPAKAYVGIHSAIYSSQNPSKNNSKNGGKPVNGTSKKHFFPNLYELQLEEMDNDVLIEKFSRSSIVAFHSNELKMQ